MRYEVRNAGRDDEETAALGSSAARTADGLLAPLLSITTRTTTTPQYTPILPNTPRRSSLFCQHYPLCHNTAPTLTLYYYAIMLPNPVLPCSHTNPCIILPTASTAHRLTLPRLPFLPQGSHQCRSSPVPTILSPMRPPCLSSAVTNVS